MRIDLGHSGLRISRSGRFHRPSPRTLCCTDRPRCRSSRPNTLRYRSRADPSVRDRARSALRKTLRSTWPTGNRKSGELLGLLKDVPSHPGDLPRSSGHRWICSRCWTAALPRTPEQTYISSSSSPISADSGSGAGLIPTLCVLFPLCRVWCNCQKSYVSDGSIRAGFALWEQTVDTRTLWRHSVIDAWPAEHLVSQSVSRTHHDLLVCRFITAVPGDV